MQYRKIKIKENTNKIKSSTKDSFLDELLALRNLVNEKDIKKFLNPTKQDLISPYAFLDMEKTKNRIFEAIEKKQKILIWGDFDCDGVTSSAILYKALKKLNADFINFIPDRLLHGHGLNSKELLKFISKEKVKLVITVDCGISNVSEVNLLKGLNVDTIITDHHSTDTELPNAYCIINPQVKNALKEDLSFEEIQSLSSNCGAGIAYKLAMALLENIDDNNLKDELMLIAACGTIADVVSLLGENRALVSEALNILNTKKENSHKGIYQLLSKNINSEITSYDIAFILAPRINAVGRLANAKLSFDFLTTDDDTKLSMIIEKLDNYNKIRQSKCSETFEEVNDYLKKHKDEQNNPAIILLNPEWHIGIIGIVAAKIVEEYNKPCFLMTVDENNNARCSIRSNDLINVYSVLKENENLFLGFGGHKLAGGCSFNKDDFEIVKNSLLKTIKEQMPNEKQENILYADMELRPNDIELDILDSINKLEPFGQDNQAPIFAMFDVNLDEFKLIGKEQNHLRLVFSKDDKKFQCVKWNENEVKIPLKAKCDIAFYPRLNEFNDIKNVQLEIIDIYSSQYTNQLQSKIKLFDHRKKTGILSQISSYLERDNVDVAIWAKNPLTKELLSKYQKIKENIIDKLNSHNGLMFFDYPSSYEEMSQILSQIRPDKIHFMNYKIDENLENYIKQINGMIKFCHNKLKGNIEISKIAQALGTSESFIQISLEILEDINSIKILDIDKIEYLKPFNYEDFKNNSLFEVLTEEFENIINFKKTMLNCDFSEIEEMVISVFKN